MLRSQEEATRKELTYWSDDLGDVAPDWPWLGVSCFCMNSLRRRIWAGS